MLGKAHVVRQFYGNGKASDNFYSAVLTRVLMVKSRETQIYRASFYDFDTNVNTANALNVTKSHGSNWSHSYAIR